MLRGPNADSKRHTTSKSLVSRGTSRQPESIITVANYLLERILIPLTFARTAAQPVAIQGWTALKGPVR
jgi:hypothetical protein